MMILRPQALWGLGNRVVWVIWQISFIDVICGSCTHLLSPQDGRDWLVCNFVIMYALALERGNKKTATDHTR